MILMFALYQINTLSVIFIVLARWNNSQLYDMSPHSDSLSWFWANPYLLLHFNGTCLAVKQQVV